MGWASGSRLVRKIASELMVVQPDEEARETFWREVVPEFRKMDWDTISEALEVDPALDNVLHELFSWLGEEE